MTVGDGTLVSYYGDWWMPRRVPRTYTTQTQPSKAFPKATQTEASRQLRQEIGRLNQYNDVLTAVSRKWDDLDPANVASAIHRCAKVCKQQNESFCNLREDARFQRLLHVASSCFDRWDAWSFANTTWALATIKADEAILMHNISLGVQKCIGESNPQDLCTLAWAFATLMLPDEPLFMAIAEETIAKVAEFNPQDLAMTSWAFAKAQMKHDALFASLGDAALIKIPQMRGQNFSNIIWSFGTLKILHDRLYEAFNIACADRISDFGPQELSNTLWAYGTMQIRADRLFDQAVSQVMHQVHRMDAQHICNIAWAYSKNGYRNEKLFATFCSEAIQRMDTMEALNVSNLAWAFASCGRSDERTCKRNGFRDVELLRAISARTLALGIDHFSPQNCSNLLWAYGTLGARDERVFSAVGDHSMRCIHLFDTQHLANMLWAFATVDMGHVGFASAVADEMIRRGFEAFSLQDISNMMWSLTKLRVDHEEVRKAAAIHIPTRFFDRIFTSEPSSDKGGRTNNAQLAMAIRALFLLAEHDAVWRLFDRIRTTRLNAGPDAYSALLWGAESSGDYQHALLVWAHMADTTSSKDLRAAIQNVMVMQCLKVRHFDAAITILQQMEEDGTYNVNSQRLQARIGTNKSVPTLRNFAWERRPRNEHEWVEDVHGQKLRLEKREYYKETGALAYAFQGPADDVANIIKSIETFTMEQQLWLKLAADEKGAALDSVLHEHGSPGMVLEVGCYVGYSSSRMASQLPEESKVVTLEVDPYHACVARNVIDYAGLSDRIEVIIGHSEHTIPQLAGNFGEQWADVVFFDQRGTRYHEDLINLEKARLLAPGALIIADNTLKPGAPLFMHRIFCSGPFVSQVVELEDFGGSVDDWMTVSYYVPGRQSNQAVPEALVQLGYETDAMRWKSVDERVTMDDWNVFSVHVKEIFAQNGIRPAIVTVQRGEKPKVSILSLQELEQRGK